ncbi:MAG: hypothetical protein ABI665_27815 [Vicinamibacterales bacterium]
MCANSVVSPSATPPPGRNIPSIALTAGLLLVVGGLVVLSLGSPADATIVAPPAAPAELDTAALVAAKETAPPAIDNAAPAVVIAKDAAIPVARKSSPKVAVEKKAPVAATPHVSNTERETVTPAAAPARLSYEGRVAATTSLAADEPDRALAALQQLAADQPGRPEAYEAMAGIRLRQREFGLARELLTTSLANGGKATFTVVHDHTSGNFDSRDPDAICVGELTILGSAVRFDPPGGRDHFAASWTEVRETGSNKFFGSGIGGFHVTFTADGKRRNFNLAPQSKDKAEGKLILDLLSANQRRSRNGR